MRSLELNRVSSRSHFFGIVLLIGIVAIACARAAPPDSSQALIEAPRFWNDRELADWALPVTGINVRPGHFSEQEYYAAPDAEWVRTYPVYFPGSEPAGYWDEIREKKPEPLITPGARTAADWVTAGKRVFEEMDTPFFRSTDPRLISIARSAEEYAKLGGHPQPDGTVLYVRWVPTSKGLALGVVDCSACHTRILPDGTRIPGAQFNDPGDGLAGELVTRGARLFFPEDSDAVAAWRQFAVPWITNDTHERIKTMSVEEVGALITSNPPGTFPRFNGSPYYTTKVPDLIGIKDRKYIDHTATHQLRGLGDVMRYAALVGCCDPGDFGTHRMLSDAQRKIPEKIPDHIAFALAQYLFSLEPPKNPNLSDPRAVAGRQVFEREECGTCHSPPLYTNNKLTLAKGFSLPEDHPYKTDVIPISVGTDPGLALKTRKGTGLYKVPSLKGVWYRGLLSHDGSVATLEDWFDPARLRGDYVPTGFKGYKVTRRAVPGHEFGLNLTAEEKAALIAFLRTL
jgi:mono/diheme cytochrome c family protein